MKIAIILGLVGLSLGAGIKEFSGRDCDENSEHQWPKRNIAMGTCFTMDDRTQSVSLTDGDTAGSNFQVTDEPCDSNVIGKKVWVVEGNGDGQCYNVKDEGIRSVQLGLF